eukprot:CAMPEP_0197037180 /NCGR_PEP_ID=MMETSP1384-20130603/14450_1 /TAXON_ID=29189 /ORGANISM="Ammonia sp." /LENGTH=434 /DNA_ID=CAMNT_0042467445 /DNA_START=24 /DNA_END=1325 /DNA_ORIENTATION=+
MVYKRAALKSFVAGFRDALWPGMLIYVVTSPLIRKRYFQCFVLNGIIFIGSIIALNYIVIPIFVFLLQLAGFSSASTEWAEFAVDTLYKAIWVLPLYIFSFVVNSLWYQDIAEQAHTLYSASRIEEEKSMSKLLHKMNRAKQIQRAKSSNHSPTGSSTYSSPLRNGHKHVHNNHHHNNHNNNNGSFSFSSPTLKDEMVKHNLSSSKNGFYHYDDNAMEELPARFVRSKSSNSFKKLKSGKHKKSASSSSSNVFYSIRNSLNEEIYHTLFLIVFNCQIVLFAKLGSILSLIASSLSYSLTSMLFDYIGFAIAFLLFCWQHAFLSFEYKWIMEGKELRFRIKYFEERVPYFSGFGAPLTLLVLLAPQFISTGIYALTFPLFIIQAIESNPVTSFGAEQKGQHHHHSNQSKHNLMHHKPLRIPVFTTTKWLQYVVIW